MTAFVGNGRLANGRVSHLTLTREGGALSLSLSICELESQAPVELLFCNVSDLRFRGQRTELTQLVLLIAEDVSSAGWEGVHFAVRDYEEEFISFRCARIERG